MLRLGIARGALVVGNARSVMCFNGADFGGETVCTPGAVDSSLNAVCQTGPAVNGWVNVYCQTNGAGVGVQILQWCAELAGRLER